MNKTAMYVRENQYFEQKKERSDPDIGATQTKSDLLYKLQVDKKYCSPPMFYQLDKKQIKFNHLVNKRNVPSFQVQTPLAKTFSEVKAQPLKISSYLT